MKASVVDLRYKMKDILKALRRNEKVQILYHGKVTALMVPVHQAQPKGKMKDHPLFGLDKRPATQESVDKEMDILRGGRFRDL